MLPDGAIKYLLGTHYISGPMTGRKRYNFDAFYACEAWLTEQGIRSHNPARIDEEVYGFDPDGTVEDQGFSIHDALTRDINFILSDECVGVIVLPEWEMSIGAKWEVGVAQAVGKSVQEWTGTWLRPISTVVKCVVTKARVAA